MDNSPVPGRLVLAGTPIGNTEDASPALRKALAEADVIAAEDTRRLHGLLCRLGVTTSARVVSYFDGNEAARVGELLAACGRDDSQGGHTGTEQFQPGGLHVFTKL